jgi:DUF4097 and DUF4098 domain-containing protein YvlB
MHPLRALAAVVLFTLPFAQAGYARAGETLVIQPAKAETVVETRTLPLASGSRLKVKNVNGWIRVEAWDREEVQFRGEFKPSSKDEQVKVVLESGPGSLEIKGEYPKHSGSSGSYRGPECRMDLKVPRRILVRLESVNGEVALEGTLGEAVCSTVNGAVRARNLEEGLKAETVNGSLALERVRGSLDLSTVNGSISGQGLDGKAQGIAASTVNGSIKLQMAGIKGRLTATTVNGHISFNAKGAEQVEVSKRKVQATFPGSEQKISLNTVNGSITVE